jgi:hypothetical protein
MDKRCENCHATFQPHPAVRNHRYCGEPGCQKERKRLWQRHKLAIDSVYREEQADAKRQWRVNNSDYWRKYRESHPAYVKRNREKQRERNHKRPRKRDSPASPVIAKMDALTPRNIIPFGQYRLVPLANDMIAKMDELIVEIGVISRDSPPGISITPRENKNR